MSEKLERAKGRRPWANGFEPPAKRLAAKRRRGLEGSCPQSATPVDPFNEVGKTGAGEGIRTLDPNLGKVVLYP
jgi:hypothetical protein